MKYNHVEGTTRQKKRAWTVFPVIGLAAGLYVLVNAVSPAIPAAFGPTDTTAKKLVSLQPKLEENRVYAPKINVDVAVVPIDGNEAIALKKGAVQRSPASGNPRDGGNFVLAAHRFNLGLTPSQTRAQSPFYYLNQLEQGDDIYVDYEGVRYAYKVVERKLIESTAPKIEERSDDGRLTMYSPELVGNSTEREVVVAEPVGKIVWTDGRPKLKSL